MAVYLDSDRVNARLGPELLDMRCPAADIALSIVPKRMELRQESFGLFRAVTVTNNPAVPENVRWSVETPSKAFFAAPGRVVVPEDEEAGEIVVRAASLHSGAFAEAVVAVYEMYYRLILSPVSVTANVRDRVRFEAVIETNNPSLSRLVNWSLEGAEGSEITGDGVLFVHRDDAGGTFKVIAVSAHRGERAEAVITVNPWQFEFSINVSPAEIWADVNDFAQFFAVIDTNDGDVPTSGTWHVIGAVDSVISEEGLLTVGRGDAERSFTVRAVADYDENCYADAAVHVNALALEIDIQIKPAVDRVYTGFTQQFTAVVASNDPSVGPDVTWSLIGAAGSGISSGGLLTVSAADVGKTLIIRAASVTVSLFYGELAVLVEQPSISITVQPQNPTIPRNSSLQLSAAVSAEPAALPNAVTWSVSGNAHQNTRISGTGLLSVHNQEGGRTLTVRASSAYDSRFWGETAVRVT